MKTKPKPSRTTKDGRTILSAHDFRVLKDEKRRQQENRCADCGSPTPTDLHHIIERGLGGGTRDDTSANTKLLCRPCHSKYKPGPQWSGAKNGVVAL